VKYLYTLKNVVKLLKKDLDQASKKDILRILAEVEKSNYSEWTKHDYKVAIRKFYKWLGKEDLVSWIKIRVKKNRTFLPDELLSEKVLRIVKAADNLRDRVFIILLWESGGRIGEIGDMKIKDVGFHENYAAVWLHGKTGSRRIIVVLSSPYLVE